MATKRQRLKNKKKGNKKTRKNKKMVGGALPDEIEMLEFNNSKSKREESFDLLKGQMSHPPNRRRQHVGIQPMADNVLPAPSATGSQLPPAAAVSPPPPPPVPPHLPPPPPVAASEPPAVVVAVPNQQIAAAAPPAAPPAAAAPSYDPVQFKINVLDNTKKLGSMLDFTNNSRSLTSLENMPNLKGYADTINTYVEIHRIYNGMSAEDKVEFKEIISDNTIAYDKFINAMNTKKNQLSIATNVPKKKNETAEQIAKLTAELENKNEGKDGEEEEEDEEDGEEEDEEDGEEDGEEEDEEDGEEDGEEEEDEDGVSPDAPPTPVFDTESTYIVKPYTLKTNTEKKYVRIEIEGPNVRVDDSRIKTTAEWNEKRRNRLGLKPQENVNFPSFDGKIVFDVYENGKMRIRMNDGETKTINNGDELDAFKENDMKAKPPVATSNGYISTAVTATKTLIGNVGSKFKGFMVPGAAAPSAAPSDASLAAPAASPAASLAAPSGATTTTVVVPSDASLAAPAASLAAPSGATTTATTTTVVAPSDASLAAPAASPAASLAAPSGATTAATTTAVVAPPDAQSGTRL
jgi:hypothetical protein